MIISIIWEDFRSIATFNYWQVLLYANTGNVARHFMIADGDEAKLRAEWKQCAFQPKMKYTQNPSVLVFYLPYINY